MNLLFIYNSHLESPSDVSSCDFQVACVKEYSIRTHGTKCPKVKLNPAFHSCIQCDNTHNTMFLHIPITHIVSSEVSCFIMHETIWQSNRVGILE